MSHMHQQVKLELLIARSNLLADKIARALDGQTENPGEPNLSVALDILGQWKLVQDQLNELFKEQRPERSAFAQSLLQHPDNPERNPDHPGHEAWLHDVSGEGGDYAS